MALVPSCQFCQTTFLDSFHTSFSGLHAVRFHFLRHSSSYSGKKLYFYATTNAISSDSTPEEHPQKKSHLVLKKKKNTCSLARETQISSRWIENWTQDYQPMFPNRPQALLDYRNGGGGISSEDDDMGSRDSASTSGGSTMEKIVEKLKRFGYIDEANETKEAMPTSHSESVPERGSVEDIFYVEEGLLPNSRGGFSKESPLGIESVFGGNGEVRFPWEKPSVKGDEGRSLGRRRSRTSLAELTLPESELRRLRHLAVHTKQKTKIGGGGVTQAIVDLIHEKWKTAEIVRLKCEGPPALNMKRMHEILERKTGGLVIWRSGTSVSLYRGVSYELPSKQREKKWVQKTDSNPYLMPADENAKDHMEQKSVYDPQKGRKEAEQLAEVAYEDEIDKLLDGLGPRFMDWPGDDPLPVDADLLPGIVPGYKPPFRVLPYGVRATLGLNEATALRRLARVLPPHFAIGRSRQHQGLATAMVKLWERSSIAKIALKRGVQLTTSERMAEDIKKMTGGTLLSRNKDFIVFYRGKDFLSRDVTEALLEKERLAKGLQDEEEQARLRASSLVVPSINTTEESSAAGTLSETLEADARWGKRLDDSHMDEVKRAVEIARHANLVRKLERKLAIGESKLKKAERALEKVEAFLKPLEQPKNLESITDEERFMFRKLGLKMKAFLLLGRRGVFDGTVENMHLHWKYRELVKIIVKAKNFDQVRNIALSLEAESGGILVSVDKVSKGFAIIVYRGKDYKRPPSLRPKNLLTKRKALARSIELQRREAICNHISALQRSIGSLRSELGQMESVKDKGDEKLYARLDSAYSTEDEDSEGEDDNAYLMTYGSTSEGEDGVSMDTSDDENDNDGGVVISNGQFEANLPCNDQSESWDTNHESFIMQ